MNRKLYRRRSTAADVLAATGLITGGIIVSVIGFMLHACVNAVGAWIILDVFEKSLTFWQYVAVGIGLTLIVGTGSHKE